MLSKRIVSAAIGLLPFVGYSQIRQPQAPTSGGFQPVTISSPQPSSYPQSNNQTYAPQYPNTAVKMGATANDVINSSRQPLERAMSNAIAQKQQEVEQLIRDIQASQKQFGGNKDLAAAYYRPTPNPERTKDFPAALKRLDDMLKGRLKLSVADAYYTVEAAYGDPYLTRQQYNDIINKSAAFIKAWMIENGLNPKDNYQVQFAIQKFMSETLTVTKSGINKEQNIHLDAETHQPFYYDYNDYEGQKDYRNLFVTKCLATGFGQCASMPVVYLILAEALGIKAYLSFAPYHSFVKYPDNNGNIINYEPTSNWEITDKWYKDNMFISAEAVASGIYLDTLNYKQVVANCAFDLALEYIKVDLTGEENMILNCLKVGIPHFPKNNNLPSLFIYSIHLKTMLREVMRKKRHCQP